MKCCYCQQSVLSGEPITVSGVGPAHKSCFEKSLIEQRVFRDLNLRSLPVEELRELFDMVKMELNVRDAQHKQVDVWDEVTLFG
ncbi:hypothetical protein [Bacterioplanoides sp.]|uniref:hypothetical protein n=1 Tax=Bacterioplanoides sp. TaxID=2066072 RepID=UPI003B5A7078